jgi:nucleotide-binding universal stress UspA family protein
MNLSPKKILWPTDFSELSHEAGQYAREYQKVFGAELHVIHVCQPVDTPGLELEASPGIGLSISQENLVEASRRRMEQFVRSQFPTDARVTCESLVGQAWPEICDYAKRVEADLIIMATHGLTGLRHVVIGSTAERVVQHAHCPVLTVKSFDRGA